VQRHGVHVSAVRRLRMRPRPVCMLLPARKLCMQSRRDMLQALPAYPGSRLQDRALYVRGQGPLHACCSSRGWHALE
jgi:hypothetical protein